MDVPLAGRYAPPGTDERMFSPGANSDRKVATFVNHEIVSALSVAPTLMAEDTHAGAEMLDPDPLFPDATTVATPIERRLSMIGLYGRSSQVLEKRSPERLMLAATICRAADS